MAFYTPLTEERTYILHRNSGRMIIKQEQNKPWTYNGSVDEMRKIGLRSEFLVGILSLEAGYKMTSLYGKMLPFYRMGVMLAIGN